MIQSHQSLAREFGVSVPVVPMQACWDRVHVEYYGVENT